MYSYKERFYRQLEQIIDQNISLMSRGWKQEHNTRIPSTYVSI